MVDTIINPVKTTSVTVSAAEIVDLFDNPKVLIPEPGAGKAIIILNYVFIYKYDTAPYGFNNDVVVFMDGIGLGDALPDLEDSQSVLSVGSGHKPTSYIPLATANNLPVVLYADPSSPTAMGTLVEASPSLYPITNAGTGYDVGDTGDIVQQGGSGGTYTVLTVDAGAVTSFSIDTGGAYNLGDCTTTVSTGAGDGTFAITVDELTDTAAGTYEIELTYRIIELPA
jgi:hypothetical protein